MSFDASIFLNEAVTLELQQERETRFIALLREIDMPGAADRMQAFMNSAPLAYPTDRKNPKSRHALVGHQMPFETMHQVAVFQFGQMTLHEQQQGKDPADPAALGLTHVRIAEAEARSFVLVFEVKFNARFPKQAALTQPKREDLSVPIPGQKPSGTTAVYGS